VFALIEPEFDEAFGMRVIGLTSRSSVVELEQALPNLLLTPPVAWISRQAWERLVQALAEHVRAYAAERGKGGG
jgi:lactate dehydrogenase-like 2-hydroxyacid dehydrogenase